MTGARDPPAGRRQHILKLLRNPFITHDLAIAHATVTMYQGRVVSRVPKREVLTPPHDAYTDLSLQSVPEMEVGWLEQALETRRMAAAGN